jgi:PHS family inorganic phosphate transporter-like MFS transporter
MTAVFSMQGIGSLLSAMIVYIVLYLGFDAGFAWRFALFCGALPAILAFPWRIRMHETETFERVKRERREAKDQIESAVVDSTMLGLTIDGDHSTINNYQSINGSDLDRSGHSISSNLAVVAELSGRLGELRRAFFFYKWHILGTSLSWFLLDVDFYANGLFNHDITALILSPDAISTAMDDAWNSGFICLVGLPGYILSYLYIDSFGRKNIQMLGFTMMCLLYLLCSYGHDFFMATDLDDPVGTWMRRSSYLLVYSLTFLFSNFGPNTTSFVVPGEIYPAEVRATAHGLSAAFGKLGAACGAYFFPLFDYRESMRICALVAGLGVAVTYFFTPRYGAEDLRMEDTYIALEHECLRPNEVTAEQYKKKKSGMIHVIDSSYDFETLLEEGGDE